MRKLLLLSALLLPTLVGCGSSDGHIEHTETIYNVGYKWDYDEHRYEVYAYDGDYDERKTYYVSVENYHYVEVAEYKTYVVEKDGGKYVATINNEYCNSHLYIYHKR